MRTKAARLALALIAILLFPSVSFAQIEVIISDGFTAAYRELLPNKRLGSTLRRHLAVRSERAERDRPAAGERGA